MSESDTYAKLRQIPFHYYVIGTLLFYSVLIIYINATKLEEPLDNCPPYLTYIISSSVRRYNFTFNNLQVNVPNYFNVSQKKPVSLNDSRIYHGSDISASSLLQTFIELWRDFGARPETEYSDNDWMFIFEDDVNLVPYGIIKRFYPKLFAKWKYADPKTSIAGLVEQGLQMAKKDGILYLGTCGPEYQDNITTIRYCNDGLFEFRRGAYYCTHAVAYTKWRARRIWGDFAIYKFFHGESGSDTIARQWMLLSKTFPISVATNIHWPPNTAHFGLFFQDRGAISSTRVG